MLDSKPKFFLQESGTNKPGTLSSLKSKGLFTNSCNLTLKMKKCLSNYPGLTEIITKYTGKTTRWHCSNQCCTYNSNFNTYWGCRGSRSGTTANKINPYYLIGSIFF